MNSPSLLPALLQFERWLDAFGETSQDHQDFYAGAIGRRAKEIYYKGHRMLGLLAVAPMVACEALVPRSRALFHERMRLPIADAHYAMGFTHLFKVTGDERHLERARHFLAVLEASRCAGYERHAWGYPFDWQTRKGLITSSTPLITTVPYCYEAFQGVFRVTGENRLRAVMHSTAEHALVDYCDRETGADAATCSYTPTDGHGVVNASAYRAFLLMSAWRDFDDERYLHAAKKNINFVLQAQLDDGSWPYAVDGTRDFVDHFHTCFVLKALAKIEALAPSARLSEAIDRGVAYYLSALFDSEGLPKPFAKAPRLTVYRRELYDFAECLNLGMLLRGKYLDLDRRVQSVLETLLATWRQRDGSFRSRELLFGWDNVPMHRWGQSMVFRSLTLVLLSQQPSSS